MKPIAGGNHAPWMGASNAQAANSTSMPASSPDFMCFEAQWQAGLAQMA